MNLTSSFLTWAKGYVLLRDMTFPLPSVPNSLPLLSSRIIALGAYYQGAGRSLLWLSCFGKEKVETWFRVKFKTDNLVLDSDVLWDYPTPYMSRINYFLLDSSPFGDSVLATAGEELSLTRH